jgi:hypothetical protein
VYKPSGMTPSQSRRSAHNVRLAVCVAWTLTAASACTTPLADPVSDRVIGDQRAGLSHAQARISSEILAPWLGKLAPLADRDRLGFYSADLGHVLKHRDAIRMIFGDGCRDRYCFPLSLYSDDTAADISLAAFPDGAALERFYAEQTPPGGVRAWQNTVAPPLVLQRTALGTVKPSELYRDGVPLDLGLFRAPTTAFSNAADGLFVLFDRNVAVECNDSPNGACPDGLRCDLAARSCSSSFGDVSACTESSDDCSCQRRATSGLCVDPGTSVYDDSEVGRFLSVAHRMDVAVEDVATPGTYRARPWVTQRFINVAARTVTDFDPARAGGVGNDYSTPDVLVDPTRQRVFLWGRASFVGVASAGLDAKLYFAYVDMPRYESQGQFAWAPQYFTGMNGAVPQFSPREADAAPLDLSDGAGDTAEPNDAVFLGSVAYVPSLQRWVMFYGGGLAGIGLRHWLGELAPLAQPIPDGNILARFAAQPWGPWSTPVAVFGPGDPAVQPPVAGSQYAAGGIVHHPDCHGAGCAPGEPYIAPGEAGYLYAPYIQDPWTIGREPGKADIYWNVSCMAPYGVVAMRSTIELGEAP